MTSKAYLHQPYRISCERMIEELLPKVQTGDLDNPAGLQQWRLLARQYVFVQGEGALEELCAQIWEKNEKWTLTRELQEIVVANVFGIISTLTIDFDYAQKQANKVQTYWQKKGMKKYKVLLLENSD